VHASIKAIRRSNASILYEFTRNKMFIFLISTTLGSRFNDNIRNWNYCIFYFLRGMSFNLMQRMFYEKTLTRGDILTLPRHSNLRMSKKTTSLRVQWGLLNSSLLNFTAETLNVHHLYSTLYVLNWRNRTITITKTLLHQWQRGVKLLLNIFFYDTRLLVFSVTQLKNETAAINWSNLKNAQNVNITFVSQAFIRANKYNDDTRDFFTYLTTISNIVVAVTHVTYHICNITYAKLYNFLTCGLIASNDNPWMVAFAFPVLHAHFIAQFFF